MQSTGSQSSAGVTGLVNSRWLARLVDFVVVPALLLYSLWLPPASLGDRLLHLDATLVTPEEGGTVPSEDGATLVIPAAAVAEHVRVEIERLEATDAGVPAAARLPDNLVAVGPLYRIQAYGEIPAQATLTLPVPAQIAAPETADLLCWQDGQWRWTASQITEDGASLAAQIDPVPEIAMIAQVQSRAPLVGMSAPEGLGGAESATTQAQQLSSIAASVVYVGDAHLDGTYGVTGFIPDPTPFRTSSDSLALLSLSSSIDGLVRSDLVHNALSSPETRRAHANAILSAALDRGYDGVELAYAGVEPAMRLDYVDFVRTLADALHSENLVLAVRLDLPTRTADGWDTGAYDWQALGAAADIVRLPVFRDLSAYAPNGDMDHLLTWATGEIERVKLDLVISAAALDTEGDTTRTFPYAMALADLASSMDLDSSEGLAAPGEMLTASLPTLTASPLQYDENAQAYWFTRQDSEGKTHTVILETGSSASRKIQYVAHYGLGHVSLENWSPAQSDGSIAQVVETFQQNIASAPQEYALVWTLADQQGNTLLQSVSSLDVAQSSLAAPATPGHYVIKAALSNDGGRTSLQVSAAATFVVPTPTLTPSPTPSATPTPLPSDSPSAPGHAAASAAPAPVTSAGTFGYGIQAAMVSDTDHNRIFSYITGMGFNWVKQQVEWFRYNPAPGVYDWGPLDRIVDAATASGVKVLFSVVKAPEWARPAGDDRSVAGPPADPNTYGTFMREMAARYRGRVQAYELWNEQNLWYEWGGRGQRLNAAQYVELLRVAYTNIKAVDPSAIVVSGALTPTGFNDGDTAIDDRVYLEQMYQAGVARYCDAIGAHPSGYNNPPDADWMTYNDPNEPNCKGHPSWFFRSTLESYRNIMIKYGDAGKKIWPTEFGWATVEGLGVAPAAGYEYAANNSEAEQAQYLARAYALGRSWGWVGPMFVWNLNFAPVAGQADEKAAFGIVRADWSPRPAYAALRDMPK